MIAGQAGDRNKPRGPDLIQRNKQSELGDAADMRREKSADGIGNEQRAVALDCGAFCCGSAPFSRRKMLFDCTHPIAVEPGRQGTGIETVPCSLGPGNQRAMDEQISISTDWRRKMRIAPEAQSEMADVVRAVDGLGLTTQDEIIDKGSCRTFLSPS